MPVREAEAVAVLPHGQGDEGVAHLRGGGREITKYMYICLSLSLYIYIYVYMYTHNLYIERDNSNNNNNNHNIYLNIS